jgi:hypothetical protein
MSTNNKISFDSYSGRNTELALPGIELGLGYCSWYSGWLQVGRKRDRSSSPGRGKISLLSTASRPVLGPTQPPIQWVPGAVTPGGKATGACRGQEFVDLYTHSPIRLRSVVLN